ncbi:helix-turn-helix domain-containing protein [Tenacibaculum agarivorans]|uniref:helix-turn-helix domain-containing protein n=1 Tax=Tenacibaculum agarivorans TaxID=1908389 RepID=UPI00094BC0AB|nr:AraC family transcriptional regulator [Tenacibaculum agarivorans]
MANNIKLEVEKVVPKGNLNQFIDSIWLFKNNNLDDINYTIIPDGFFKLIIIYINGELQIIKLVGLFNESVPIITPSNSVTFLIKFKLLASEYLFNHAIGSLLNSREELDHSFWNINDFKSSILNDFIDHIKQIPVFSNIKMNNIPEKKRALSKLVYSSYSSDNVTKIVNQIDWSHRQINRYLKKHMGVSIKEYLNILKCAETYDQISKGELFPNGNYTDQSHFSRSIKKQTGTTPQKLYENQNDQFVQLKLTDKT